MLVNKFHINSVRHYMTHHDAKIFFFVETSKFLEQFMK